MKSTEKKPEKIEIGFEDDRPIGGTGGGGLGGGGTAGGELIEIDQDWGEPPPRIKKRFGKKGKKGQAKTPKKKGKNKTKTKKREENLKLLNKRRNYDPRAAIKKAQETQEDEKSVKLDSEPEMKANEQSNYSEDQASAPDKKNNEQENHPN